MTLNGKPLVVCWGRGCVHDPKNWNTRPIEDALHARIAELEAQLAEALPYLINEKIRKGQFEEVN